MMGRRWSINPSNSAQSILIAVSEEYDMGSLASYLPYVGTEEVAGKENVIKTAKHCTAELIGTLFLVLIGCGSCLGANGPENSPTDFVRIALAFGVTVATIAQSIGHVSGCHINPAVTAGLLFGRKIGLIKSLFYIVAQCLGAVIGAGLLLILAPTDMRGAAGLGQTSLAANVTPGQVRTLTRSVIATLALRVCARSCHFIVDRESESNILYFTGLWHRIPHHVCFGALRFWCSRWWR